MSEGLSESEQLLRFFGVMAAALGVALILGSAIFWYFSREQGKRVRRERK